jgi:hypothetical protein
MYDDCQKNLNAFMGLAEEFSDVKFFAIQVDEKGEHCEKYRSYNRTSSS